MSCSLCVCTYVHVQHLLIMYVHTYLSKCVCIKYARAPANIHIYICCIYAMFTLYAHMLFDCVSLSSINGCVLV